MPNIKSAKKRVLVNTKKAEQNKSIRSEVKSSIKKVEISIKENNLEAAKIALSEAFAIIDSACSKNILHANNAANKKARLSKKVSLLEKASAPVVEEVKEEVKEEVPAEPVKKTRKPRAKKTEVAE